MLHAGLDLSRKKVDVCLFLARNERVQTKRGRVLQRGRRGPAASWPVPGRRMLTGKLSSKSAFPGGREPFANRAGPHRTKRVKGVASVLPVDHDRRVPGVDLSGPVGAEPVIGEHRTPKWGQLRASLSI
jgi:hypothetical protein